MSRCADCAHFDAVKREDIYPESAYKVCGRAGYLVSANDFTCEGKGFKAKGKNDESQ